MLSSTSSRVRPPGCPSNAYDLTITYNFIIAVIILSTCLVLFGFLCALGIRGGFILGITAAEVLTSYWSSRYRSSHPPKIYAFNRRIHHGEIGTILALSSLFLRTATPAASVAAILTGIGIGLAKDDRADIMEWFRLRKRERDIDQDQQKGEERAVQKGKGEEAAAAAIKEYPHHLIANIQEEENPLDLSIETTLSHYKSKSKSEKVNLEHLRKQIRNLIDLQSQTVKEIELKIKRSQRYLLD